MDVWKFLTPEFVFGGDTRYLAGRFAKNLGLDKVLVVTDPGVVTARWTEHVVASLEAVGVTCTVFCGVTPNPRTEEVMAGAEAYQHARCNGIVAVGGGSPIDCAKGIGIVASNGRHILDFEGVDEVGAPGPPLICVPTTGSSADVSQFAIITDRARQSKIAIVSKAIVPDVSLIDPLTTTTLSPFQTACTAIDALTHAVEAFVSTSHSPVTDLHALDAIRRISRNLPRLFNGSDGLEPRREHMLGSVAAGLAFSNASMGAVHAMAHSVGALLDLTHGECVSMLLGPVIAFNFDSAADRYTSIGHAIGLDLHGMSAGERRSALVDAAARLRALAGLERTLGQAGVRSSDIPALARNAMNDPCLVTNPRRPEASEVEALFEAAL